MNCKRIVFIFILAVMLSGCSSLMQKREVTNNVFTSPFPHITVDVAPDFKYIGNPSLNFLSSSTDNRDLNASSDYYCFVSLQDNIASKVFSIEFRTTQTYFVSDFFSRVRDTLAKGSVDCGREPFQYYIVAIHPSASGPVTRLVSDKGYIMPFGLLKVYGKIYGAKGDNLVKFTYYEPFEDSMKDEQWKMEEALNRSQVDYIKKFSQRADLAFKLNK